MCREEICSTCTARHDARTQPTDTHTHRTTRRTQPTDLFALRKGPGHHVIATGQEGKEDLRCVRGRGCSGHMVHARSSPPAAPGTAWCPLTAVPACPSTHAAGPGGHDTLYIAVRDMVQGRKHSFREHASHMFTRYLDWTTFLS
jgi:hypothetical protein